MVHFITVIVFLNPLLICIASNDVTVIKRGVFARKKRYVTFPKGSTLVIQLSAIKAIQQVQPTPWNFLGELEFPFFLPDDANIFRRKNKVDRDRRDVYTIIREAFTKGGYDGSSCVKRVICDTKYLLYARGKSMVNDMIRLIFSDLNFNYKVDCDTSVEKCSFSILNLLLKKPGRKEMYKG